MAPSKPIPGRSPRPGAIRDTLIPLGTSKAYVYAVLATLLPDFLIDQGLLPQVYYDPPHCDHLNSPGADCGKTESTRKTLRLSASS